ncbi:unnamed protein product [Camellia sinensis]
MRGGRQCNLFELDLKLFNFNWLICSIGVQNMGKCKGCGKLRSMVLRDGSVSRESGSLTGNMECTKVPPGVRKAKKKQVKDELDRRKQAEKKKRRLEKALATSAAIRSELEKKKQKKIEEQQKLDEEGAAIAEAVALHVLLGEDSEDSCKIMLKKDEGFSAWDCASNIDLFMGGTRVVLPHPDLSKHSLEGSGWVPCAHGSECKWNEWENSDRSVTPGPFVGDFYTPYSDERVWENAEITAGHIAAQAVASLQIVEDAHVDSYLFNRMLRGE